MSRAEELQPLTPPRDAYVSRQHPTLSTASPALVRALDFGAPATAYSGLEGMSAFTHAPAAAPATPVDVGKHGCGNANSERMPVEEVVVNLGPIDLAPSSSSSQLTEDGLDDWPASGSASSESPQSVLPDPSTPPVHRLAALASRSDPWLRPPVTELTTNPGVLASPLAAPRLDTSVMCDADDLSCGLGDESASDASDCCDSSPVPAGAPEDATPLKINARRSAT
ncbi:uncharacterized protein AMSG_08586 [Thecamonas trahens ATCC 50062]|uniref:Uncharacterized protein n=1 Tax=Thecamonas trahens ATCC 50062 TaxID=461836 RepID=A0A0L0DMS0_THETB|nr:hypothetical protein AMSG_08586 [Thecamonas trahens ATCC 50062]KNC52708.1 hypothetical protein AMSG_08586 [Thecamonas trahens ATCC 50062]|eukprot:XP_013755028.1 hypothetical protein AMSG_08586 [Thecamonas trahens ATCC 50062]